MHDLPWPDESVDVVTSFRGIWGGCEGALAEAVRVCRPGGHVGLSFWGNPKRMAAYPLLKLFGQLEEHDYRHAKQMSNIAWEGVAEQMMVEAGLRPGTRWKLRVPLAFPDPELTARAFSSSGPSYLAMDLATPQSAILSAVIFNALVIVALIPLALKGVTYKALGAATVLRNNLLVYGVGGLIVPFVGIKAIDLVLVLFGLA